MQSSVSALEYASDELKADREVVLAAVNNDSDAIKFASDELIDELKKEGLLDDE